MPMPYRSLMPDVHLARRTRPVRGYEARWLPSLQPQYRHPREQIMAARVQINPGDVFQIPIDSERVGYGQVVLRPEQNVRSVLFVCVYAQTTRPHESPNVQQIILSDILLAGLTFDAKLHNGDWPIVGSVTENLPNIALPNYKYRMSEKAVVETLDRRRRRWATPEEEKSLPFRTYASPMVFELALKAISGVGQWRDDFNNLKYEELRKSESIVV